MIANHDPKAIDRIAVGVLGLLAVVAALTFRDYGLGWDDYTRLGDPAIDTLADKFDVVRDERLEGKTHPFGARVSITTEDGVHERIYADPSGEPNSFPTDQAMAQKFLQLARPVLDGRAQAFADAVLALERFDKASAVTELAR